MTNYIIIQFSKLKVPLISSQKKYEMKIAGQKIIFDPFFESLVAFQIYTGYTNRGISALLRYNYDFMTAYHIDEFIEKFKEDHVVEEIDYSFEKIPCIAKENSCFEMRLSIIKHPISISYTQELELLDIIRDNSCNRKAKLIGWWSKYCINYDIHTRLKRDSKIKCTSLAETFCQLHGVDFDFLQIRKEKELEPQQTASCKILSFLFIVIALIVYSCVAVFFIIWGSEVSNFLAGGLLMTCGFAMISVPIAIFFKK